MSIRILPDPAAPLGGAALVHLPRGIAQGDTAQISIQSGYTQLWLAPTEGESELIHVGEANWQAEPFAFGPYPIEVHDEGDVFRIGPEIVNKLEEFSPLHVVIGGRDFAISWPDDVMPRTGAALLGGVSGIRRGAATDDADKRLVGRKPDTPVDEVPEDAVVAQVDAVEPVDMPSYDDEPTASIEEVDDEARRPRSWLLAGLLAALFLVFALAFFFWPQDDEVVVDPATAPAPPIAQAGGDCSFAGLSAVAGGFEGVTRALAACGNTVSADTALGILEQATALDVAEAWMIMGGLYDGEVQHPVYESQAGLTFDENPARAAEFYSRARALGAAAAGDRLSSVCARLETRTDTLSQGAFDDFCR